VLLELGGFRDGDQFGAFLRFCHSSILWQPPVDISRLHGRLSLDGKGFLGYAGNGGDPYIRHKQEAAIEPVRVVVELQQADFARLNKICGRIAPQDFLRLVALERIAEVTRLA
jgi:hypothetical protein